MKSGTIYFGRKKRKKVGTVLLSVAALLILSVWLVESRIQPVLSTIAESRAKNIASDAVNDSICNVLGGENIKYDNLVELTKNTEGVVTAITTDSVRLNTLCTEIRTKITEYFEKLTDKKINIAIGSLTGVDMLAGKGPAIPVNITLSGSSTTKIVNNFETAGINQTRHQIILEITTKVYVIMQSGNLSTEITNSMVVAETVIVGAVPEIYSDGSDDLWQNLVGFDK